jgi:polar amino acid transport system substrate-binding protein
MTKILMACLITLWLSVGPAGDSAGADTLENIKSRGYMIVGVEDDEPPFGFPAPQNSTLIGFDCDVSAYIAQKLGVELKLKPVQTTSGVDMLTQGTVDMLAAKLVHTFERDKVIDFSLSYFRNGQGLLVSVDSGFASLSDLAGHKIGVLKNDQRNEPWLALEPESPVVPYETLAAAFSALQEETIRAVGADRLSLAALRGSSSDPDSWRVVPTPYAPKYLGLGLPENDSAFRDQINMALAEMWTSSEYQRIYTRWFGSGTGYALDLDWEMEIWQ